MKKTVRQQCVDRDIKAGTCSNRCPQIEQPTYSESISHLIQSNKKFKDFNFSLKLVTVADETTVSGREFQTLITRFEKK